MNSNETRTLWISIGSALFAVFLLYSYTQEKTSELNKKLGATTTVVVAKTDINEMETITIDMLETVSSPTAYAQPSHFKAPEEVVGRVALAPIKEKEQVLESKVLEPGPVTGLALQVGPQRRALTIPVDEMRGVAKLVKPGDRVDIVAALDVGKGAQQKRIVKTLMQDVAILATGLRVVNDLPRLFEKGGDDEFVRNYRGDTTFSSITVEATPKQAQDLIYILSTSPGSIFMTLRHPSDRIQNRISQSTIESVLNQVPQRNIASAVKRQTPQPAARPQPKPKPKPKKKRGPFIDL
jgi:pilus assembly protein CpaB